MTIPNSLRKFAEEKEIKNVCPKTIRNETENKSVDRLLVLSTARGNAYRNFKESRRRKEEGVKRLRTTFFSATQKLSFGCLFYNGLL